MNSYTLILVYDNVKHNPPAKEFKITNCRHLFEAVKVLADDPSIDLESNFTIFVEKEGEQYKTLIHHRPKLTEEMAIVNYESYFMNDL